MKFVRIRGSPQVPPAEGLVNSIQPRHRTPIQRPSDIVDTPTEDGLYQKRNGKDISKETCCPYCAGYDGPLPRDSMRSISPGREDIKARL
jgi:hypothetical protein